MPDSTTNPVAVQPDGTAAEPVRQSPQDRLKEITAGIEQGIKDLFNSDRYASYLRTMSHFHHYSVNNTMLIYMQKPDATLVAGFNKWKDQFERHVNRGEKGIKIIAPVMVSTRQTREKRDPQTHAVMLDQQGQAITEEIEVKVPLFRVASVFDISQTDGKPLPTLVNDLHENVEHFDAFMEAVLRSSPVPLEIGPIENGADGFFNPSQQQIMLREGMSEAQTVSAAIHEITHATLHNYNQKQNAQGDVANLQPKDRRTEEVEAESVSYAVCQYYGIETADNSFGYIAEWSQGRDLPELRSSLETINRTASDLITKIDKNLREIMQERGLMQGQEQAQEAPTEQIASSPVTEASKPSYTIFQLREDTDRRLRFTSMKELQQHGLSVNGENYQQVYAATLPASAMENVETTLNSLYHQFNLDHPVDFMGHSLSVSDVIALSSGGRTDYYYVDSHRFAPLEHFTPPQAEKENYLKSAEMALEDDYGMIDGIINNDKNPAVEQAETMKPKAAMPSMREQLQLARQQTQNQPHHTAPTPKREKER